MGRQGYTADKLEAFVAESNRIEGIHVRPDLIPSRDFLVLEQLSVAGLCVFVQDEAGAKLRAIPGMNVRIGNHKPMPGGPAVVLTLDHILREAWANARTPFDIHRRYETLHPFMDGNGRSGRILWAWQMIHHDIAPRLKLGFLHAYYYQTLAAGGPHA